MRCAAVLLVALAAHVALAALCVDSVTICPDAVQFCCCTSGSGAPVCTCCLNATEACAAGVCVAASATPSASFSSSATPSATPSATATASATPAPTVGTSATRTSTPTPTRSAVPTSSPSRTRTPTPSCPQLDGAVTIGCNASTIRLAGGAVIAAPFALGNGTQLEVPDGSLGVAAAVSFALDTPPVAVRNGSLALLPGGGVVVAVAPDDNRTRVVLFEASDGISVDPTFTVATDSACVDAAADTATPGQFAVLLTPAAACRGRHNDGGVGAWPWIVLGVGGGVMVCAGVCVVGAIVAGMCAFHHGYARSVLFNRREAADDSIIATSSR